MAAPPNEVLLVGEVVGDGVEDALGGGQDLGADAVAGQRDDVGHACATSAVVTGPRRSRSRS